MSDQNYFLSTNVIGDFNDSTLDNSGYGVLPAAEKNQTYFAYFTSVGSTTPEIIDQTSYFIKYLIDAQGNVVAPQPNSIDILNIKQNFENGRIVNITSLEGTTTFNPLLGTKVITDFGKIETISNSQTGSGITDSTGSLNFINNIASYNYGNYNFSFLTSKQGGSQLNLNSTFQTVSFNSASYNPNSNYTASTANNYNFNQSTIANNNPVIFRTQLSFRPATDPLYTNVSFYLPTFVTVRIVTSSASNPTVFDYVLKEQSFNLNTTGSSQIKIIDTPISNFSVGSRVRVEALSPTLPINGGSYPRIEAGPATYFTLIPSYVDTVKVNSPYFTTGSINDSYLTASSALGNMYYLNVKQVDVTSSLGFNIINNSFKPQPGDYIRFEYNPSKTYTIYEIINDGDYNLVLRLNKGILEGTNINNFVIYRINPNSGNQLILDVKKAENTTGVPLTGFIKPQHMTKELEDNFTTIIQKLSAEGTI